MKKIVIVLLILGSVLVMLGAMLKILHYEASDVLLLTGILCSAIAFVGMAWSAKKVKV
jgi:hypothetical protein